MIEIIDKCLPKVKKFKFKEIKILKSNCSCNFLPNLYLKHISYRFQLLMLILIYIDAVFAISANNQANIKAYTDIINVVTVFTLIILYLDKRKEWNITE